jgi:hypothetical protein
MLFPAIFVYIAVPATTCITMRQASDGRKGGKSQRLQPKA